MRDCARGRFNRVVRRRGRRPGGRGRSPGARPADAAGGGRPLGGSRGARRPLQARGAACDPYLGVEGASSLTLPHRLNTRIILVGHGRLLLVSDDREAFWFLPGGHVDPEETLEGALVRETAEETGIAVAPEQMLYLREFVDDHLHEHAIECYFLGRIAGGTVRMGADPRFRDISTAHGQATRARWFDRDALRRIVVYPDALRDRLWEGLAAPLPDRYLGTARLG